MMFTTPDKYIQNFDRHNKKNMTEEKTQIAENIKRDSVDQSKLAQKEKDCSLICD